MVLLVVDVQQLITSPDLFNYDQFLRNLKTLIEAARSNEIEVIYVRHDDGLDAELTPGNDGYEIASEIAPLDNEMIFDKRVNSPFKESGLLDYLREKEVKSLIVTGLQTEYCIDATVKCGFEHGFNIIVPAGCNSTVDNSYVSADDTYNYYNNFIWKNRYAECISLEDTLEFIRESKS